MYNDEDRLTSVTYPSGGGSATDTYLYNALGQRMQANFNGVIRNYLYHGDRVLLEMIAGGQLGAHITESGSYYAPWMNMQSRDGRKNYPAYDGTGSVRRLMNPDGTERGHYSYSAFGEERDSWTAYHNPYHFGGAWGYITDPSGLLQLGARYYWPELGRFIQQDPAGDGVNWYAYAEDNPVRGVDPEGLWYFDLGGSAGALGFGGVGGFMIGPDPCADPEGSWLGKWVHPYAGGGALVNKKWPGFNWGWSATFSFDDPTAGDYTAIQAGFGFGGQAGGDTCGNRFVEFGYVSPGITAARYQVW